MNTLALKSGIGTSNDIENNIQALKKWGVTTESDPDDKLDYLCASNIVSLLIDENDDFDSLKQKKIIDLKAKQNQSVYPEEAEVIIDKTVAYINNRNFDHTYDFEYTDDVKLDIEEAQKGDIIFFEGNFKKVEENGQLSEAKFEEVYKHLTIADSYYIDFEKAEVIPYYPEETNTSYLNENFKLLSNNNHVFNTEGFRVSYTLNKSGIDVHVSRDLNGVNIYGDISLNNVKPVFKWTYEKDDIKNCYFNLSFKTIEQLGASIGKYGNYHLKLKDVDSSSFKSLIGSIIEKQNDEVEATIKVCQIKTPVPNVPTAYLNIDLLIKLYVSGKVEVVLSNTHSLGFETRNGQIRFINDTSRDLDAIIQASAKAALGLNFNLEAVKFRLCDIELDGGVKALVKSTLHLYDKEGNLKSEESVYALSALEELSEGNPDVKVCGDISLYYLLDLIINTSKTQMAKYGFSKTYNIMDEDNQIFNNLSHIEDGHFVKSCTRKKRNAPIIMEPVKSNRIVLDSYAEVLKKDQSYQIKIISLPEGYTDSDIYYSSSDNRIATVFNGLIQPVSPGSAKIRVYSKDNKYDAYVNILVSTQ